MKFQLEPDNVNQPDDALLSDLRRVAGLIQPARISKDLYDKHGRWCAATMRKRFGNWNKALIQAGLQPTKLMFIPPEDIIQDIKNVAASLGTTILSRTEYRTRGKYSDRPISRNFGNWADAARAAGLTPAYEVTEITDELCFEAIEDAWQRLGRQPRQSDLQKPASRVAEQSITKRFGSWRKALEAFVAYVNEPGDSSVSPTKTAALTDLSATSKTNLPQPTARTAGWRLRFLIMRRDNFRCVQCGKSPATDLGTLLVIDHITPWSQGGTTVYDNLRTLCEICNGGRSNLALEVPK